MAQNRLRPGPWQVISTAGSTKSIQIDYEKFQVAAGSTAEFWIDKMGLVDDSDFTILRNPVTTFQSGASTGIPQSKYAMPVRGLKPLK